MGRSVNDLCQVGCPTPGESCHTLGQPVGALQVAPLVLMAGPVEELTLHQVRARGHLTQYVALANICAMELTIAQIAEHYLTGLPTFITDMINIDEEKNIMTFWHCGNCGDRSDPTIIAACTCSPLKNIRSR